MPILIFESDLVLECETVIGLASKKAGVNKILAGYKAEKELSEELNTENYPDDIYTEDGKVLSFKIVDFDEYLNL